MPELAPINIRVEADDGTFFEYSAKCYVTKEGGEFRVDLDDRLVEIAEKMPRHNVTLERSVRGYKSYKLSAKALGYITTFIRDCAKDYLTCEVKTERVIVYGHDLKVAFYIHKDGSIHINGVGADEGGGWFKGADIHATRTTDFYTIGLAAAVYDKKSYIRKSGTKVLWERVDDEKDEAIEQLNRFVALRVDPDRNGYKEMPYTPEAARFFTHCLLGMCHLAHRIHSFFSSPDQLQLAISQGRLLQYPGSSECESDKNRNARRR